MMQIDRLGLILEGVGEKRDVFLGIVEVAPSLSSKQGHVTIQKKEKSVT